MHQSTSCNNDATVKSVHGPSMDQKIVACLQEVALEKRSKFYILGPGTHDRWLLNSGIL